MTRSQIAAVVDRSYATVDYHTRLLRDAGSVHKVETEWPDPSDPLFEAS